MWVPHKKQKSYVMWVPHKYKKALSVIVLKEHTQITDTYQIQNIIQTIHLGNSNLDIGCQSRAACSSDTE